MLRLRPTSCTAREITSIAAAQRVAGVPGKTHPYWNGLLYFARGALPPGYCEIRSQDLTQLQQVP